MSRQPIEINRSEKNIAASIAGELAFPLIAAVTTAAVLSVGSAIDKAINPELVEALKNNWSWWKMFTTKHAMTVLMDTAPVTTTLIMSGLAGGYGWLRSKFD